MRQSDHEVAISAGKVAAIMAAVVALLTTLNLLAVALQYATERLFFADAFVALFSTRREMNIPTWYSSLALFISSVLLAIIAWRPGIAAGGHALQWRLLTLIFLYLAVDEGAAIHERLAQAASQVIALRGAGLLNFAWVVPAGILVLLFLVAYARFIVALSARTRSLFLIAGALYIGGTLGSEMASGFYVERFGVDVGYEMITTVEEFLEMLGVVVFVYALLDYLRRSATSLRLRVADPDQPAARAANAHEP